MPNPSSLIAEAHRLSNVQEAHRAEQESGRTLNHLAILAAEVLKAPIGLISIVDTEREFLEGVSGFPEPWRSEGEVPISYSFCAHLVDAGGPLLVKDARRDDRVRENPAVSTMNFISYAGVALRDGEGEVLGGVCVIDHRVRSWQEKEVSILSHIADAAREEIDRAVLLFREKRKRERTEVRLQEELAEISRFRLLVENSLAGIYLLCDDRVLYANPRLREIFGFGPGDPVANVSIADLVAKEDRARVMANVRRGLSGELQRKSYGFRARRRDGRVIDVEVLGSRIVIDGEPALVGTLLDVTEQKRTGAKLRRAAERLRLVERATEDVIWEWDVQSGTVHWNAAGARMLRYRPEEVGSTIDWHLEHIHPEDRERVVRNLEGVIHGLGEFWTEEYRFRRGDGRYVILLDRGYVRRDVRGDPSCVTGVMMDVTERKTEEEAQRFLSEASALLDSSFDWESVTVNFARLCVPRVADYCTIDLLDEGGTLRRVAAAHVSPSREPSLSFGEADDDRVPEDSPASKVMSRGIPVFIPDADAYRLEALGYPEEMCRAMLGEERSSLIVVPLALGEHRVGVITVGTCSPGRDYNSLDRILVENLAQRVALAVDRARLYQQAQAAVRARDQVLGVVSHDLRNPLSNILLTASLLQDVGKERRTENQRWLEAISRSAQQMVEMIDDLLDVASIEAGGFSVAPADNQIEILIDRTQELLGPLAGRQGINLHTEFAADMPSIRFDAGQMLRVMSNLVGNALKFTPRGGSVVVRAEPGEGGVVVSVEDTGSGIPDELLPHVFDRFWQARPGDRRGAGLGLTIARGIVEAHGGRIWVENRPAGGSIFRFLIPAPSDARSSGGTKPRS